MAWVRDHLRRSFSYIGLPLLAACGGTPRDQAAPVPVPTPAVVQPLAAGHALAELQLRRLEYTFEAAELVRRDWPAMEAAQTCVMLIEAKSQWVVNCDAAPAGFELTLQSFREHPVYFHEGGTFEAGGELRSRAQLLATTPAAAQVAGPGRDSQGLPGDKPWLLVGSLEALTEFHPAFKHATTEAWVSVIIHELVHTHQLRAAGSERFAFAIGKLERTPRALREAYLRERGYREAVEREYQLLTRAAGVSPTDKRAARRALASWLKLYDQRLQRTQLAADDALFMYIEGVARFVESQFLEDPTLHPARALTGDPRFHDYELFIGHGYLGSPNRQLDDDYFYAIGYHVCVLLDRLDPSWRSRVHTRELFLVDVARGLVADAPK